MSILFRNCLPAITGIMFYLLPISSTAQGSLTFSGDSVIVMACTDFPNGTGILQVANNTANEIRLRWELINQSFPGNGYTALIIDPYQFVSNSSGGYAWLKEYDTTDILFHIWPDTLTSGDTALFQIKIFDVEDSIATEQILTSLIHCSFTTALSKPESNHFVKIYPNPIKSSGIIQLQTEIYNAQLVIYNHLGEVVRNIQVSGKQIHINKDHLSKGVYFICLKQDGMIVMTEKIILAD